MKLVSVVTLAAAGVALCGCATIIKGSSQSIAVETPPTTGATCVLTSREGSWTLTSPGIATVQKGADGIKAVCSKPGWQDGIATIPSGFETWTAADFVGLPLIGPGVDVASGAINHYPDSFDVPMQASSATPDTAKTASPAN